MAESKVQKVARQGTKPKQKNTAGICCGKPRQWVKLFNLESRGHRMVPWCGQCGQWVRQ